MADSAVPGSWPRFSGPDFVGRDRPPLVLSRVEDLDERAEDEKLIG